VLRTFAKARGMTAGVSQAGGQPRVWLWSTLFVLGVGVSALGRILGLIAPPTSTILFLLAMTLMIPLVKAARRRDELRGATSRALTRYNRRMLAAAGVYTLNMLLAGNLHDRIAAGSAAMWLLALVPIAPVLAMLWAMWRYLAEENDEYLRHRAIMAALFGLGVVLTLGTVWGFLEMFGLVPHVWNWWVFPAWAFGLALARCVTMRQQ